MSDRGPWGESDAGREAQHAAWNALFAEPATAEAALQRLRDAARAHGDAEVEGVVVALIAFERLVARAPDEGQSLIDAAREELRRTRSARGELLLADAGAVAAMRLGRFEDARAALQRNAALPASVRAPGEHAFTLWHQMVLCQAVQDFEAQLDAGYRLLSLAAPHGLVAFEGVARLALAAVHLTGLDFAEGVALQDTAAACLARAGATRMLWACHANRIYTHHASGQPERAGAVLLEWLAGSLRPEGPRYRVPLALGHLAAGELAQAQALLDAGPPPGPLSRHQRSAWHWARGRLLLAQQQPAAAAEVCRDGLAAGGDGANETPLNRVQLFETLREACERQGDLRGALDAAKAVRNIELPQLANHARVRYHALRCQVRAAGGAADSARDHQRLQAVDQAIEQYRRHWLIDPPHAPPAPADHATRRFVAHVSHEIRTPLTGVIGLTDLLLTSPLDAQQRHLVELARTSADTMMRLLNDILDLARLEAGRFSLEPVRFSLAQLARDLADTVGPLARARGLAFELDVDPRLPEAVVGDALRLRQVVGNLLGNAIKFTRRGHVGLAVRRDDAAAPGALRIEVSDSGDGVPPALRPRLFTEFEAGGEGGGSGLGLAISRQLVQRMGGEIGVDDRPGGGSVFWVTLRLPQAQPQSSPSA